MFTQQQLIQFLLVASEEDIMAYTALMAAQANSDPRGIFKSLKAKYSI